MPFRSQAQRRFFHWAESKGKLPKGTSAKWEAHTPAGKLPQHVEKKEPEAAPVKQAEDTAPVTPPDYRQATGSATTCLNCKNYNASDSTCKAYGDYPVGADYTCDTWQAKTPAASSLQPDLSLISPEPSPADFSMSGEASKAAASNPLQPITPAGTPGSNPLKPTQIPPAANQMHLPIRSGQPMSIEQLLQQLAPANQLHTQVFPQPVKQASLDRPALVKAAETPGPKRPPLIMRGGASASAGTQKARSASATPDDSALNTMRDFRAANPTLDYTLGFLPPYSLAQNFLEGSDAVQKGKPLAAAGYGIGAAIDALPPARGVKSLAKTPAARSAFSQVLRRLDPLISQAFTDGGAYLQKQVDQPKPAGPPMKKQSAVQKKAVTVEEGGLPSRVVAKTVGRVLGLPQMLVTERALLSPEKRKKVHERAAELLKSVRPDELEGVKLRLGGGNLVDDLLWRKADKDHQTFFRRIGGRQFQNPRTTLAGKLLTAPVTLGADVLSPLVRSSHYNPMTDAANLYVDSPAVTEHLLGHAMDYNSADREDKPRARTLLNRSLRDGYAAAPYLVPTAFSPAGAVAASALLHGSQEYRANRDSRRALQEALKDQPDELRRRLKERTAVLPAEFGATMLSVPGALLGRIGGVYAAEHYADDTDAAEKQSQVKKAAPQLPWYERPEQKATAASKPMLYAGLQRPMMLNRVAPAQSPLYAGLQRPLMLNRVTGPAQGPMRVDTGKPGLPAVTPSAPAPTPAPTKPVSDDYLRRRGLLEDPAPPRPARSTQPAQKPVLYAGPQRPASFQRVNAKPQAGYTLPDVSRSISVQGLTPPPAYGAYVQQGNRNEYRDYMNYDPQGVQAKDGKPTGRRLDKPEWPNERTVTQTAMRKQSQVKKAAPQLPWYERPQQGVMPGRQPIGPNELQGGVMPGGASTLPRPMLLNRIGNSQRPMMYAGLQRPMMLNRVTGPAQGPMRVDTGKPGMPASPTGPSYGAPGTADASNARVNRPNYQRAGVKPVPAGFQMPAASVGKTAPPKGGATVEPGPSRSTGPGPGMLGLSKQSAAPPSGQPLQPFVGNFSNLNPFYKLPMHYSDHERVSNTSAGLQEMGKWLDQPASDDFYASVDSVRNLAGRSPFYRWSKFNALPLAQRLNRAGIPVTPAQATDGLRNTVYGARAFMRESPWSALYDVDRGTFPWAKPLQQGTGKPALYPKNRSKGNETIPGPGRGVPGTAKPGVYPSDTPAQAPPVMPSAGSPGSYRAPAVPRNPQAPWAGQSYMPSPPTMPPAGSPATPAPPPGTSKPSGSSVTTAGAGKPMFPAAPGGNPLADDLAAEHDQAQAAAMQPNLGSAQAGRPGVGKGKGPGTPTRPATWRNLQPVAQGLVQAGQGAWNAASASRPGTPTRPVALQQSASPPAPAPAQQLAYQEPDAAMALPKGVHANYHKQYLQNMRNYAQLGNEYNRTSQMLSGMAAGDPRRKQLMQQAARQQQQMNQIGRLHQGLRNRAGDIGRNFRMYDLPTLAPAKQASQGMTQKRANFFKWLLGRPGAAWSGTRNWLGGGGKGLPSVATARANIRALQTQGPTPEMLRSQVSHDKAVRALASIDNKLSATTAGTSEFHNLHQMRRFAEADVQRTQAALNRAATAAKSGLPALETSLQDARQRALGRRVLAGIAGSGVGLAGLGVASLPGRNSGYRPSAVIQPTPPETTPDETPSFVPNTIKLPTPVTAKPDETPLVKGTGKAVGGKVVGDVGTPSSKDTPKNVPPAERSWLGHPMFIVPAALAATAGLGYGIHSINQRNAQERKKEEDEDEL